jgi:phytanoyl-CoA hydroxylase
MKSGDLGGVLSQQEIEQFHQVGYLIKKGIFGQEVSEMGKHFMDLHAKGPNPPYFEPVSSAEAQGDILKQFPRMMQPHRYDQRSMDWMLDKQVMDVLADLFAEEPIAMQSMFYYKPPGARGQALHQDNFYLRISPGTCIAAWTAVDDVDEENGGLIVVPQTQKFDILCPEQADMTQSFTTDLIRVPDGYEAIPAKMQAGDVLFFNGSLIHGSTSNMSKDRFRRSFICHYAGISAEKAGSYYKPNYRYNGEIINMETNEGGGPCGKEVVEVIH